MMVLDLKLASYGESSAFRVKLLPEEDSSRSNSSVLNAEVSSNGPDEDSCSTRPAAGFQFSILKNSASVEGENLEEEIEEDGNDASQEPNFVTRQHWVDLSFCQSNILVDVRVLQQAAAATACQEE